MVVRALSACLVEVEIKIDGMYVIFLEKEEERREEV